MPRLNYGPEVRKRSKRLLETLLLYASYQIDEGETLPIQINRQTDKQLVIRTKLRFLEALTDRDPHYGKLSGAEIREALNRLKDFLRILDDNRVATQGSDSWHFTIRLWHPLQAIEDNLRRFDHEWEQCKQQRRTATPKLTGVTAHSLSPGPVSETTEPTAKQIESDRETLLATLGPRQDWGEALQVTTFYGREVELAQLQQWILQDGCRLVGLLGMGGLGKTTLSIRFAELVQEQYDCVVWRSLRNAPPLKSLLLDVAQVLTHQPDLMLSESSEAQVMQFLPYLKQQRCLLVLDNVEAILQGGSQSGYYLPGYEGYGHLFRAIGDTHHTSCLLLTSREKPRQLTLAEGDGSAVRSLALKGLSVQEGKAIFTTKGCFGAKDGDWQEIFQHYAGNPLALKIIASALQEMTGGDMTDVMPFLRQGQLQFQDIHDLLYSQFQRLSEGEQQVLFWLAINREPMTLLELADDVVTDSLKRQLPEAVQSLNRRCLVDRQDKRYTLQPVVMETLIGRLVAIGVRELQTQTYQLLRDYALIKAQSPDYVRDTQCRLILSPIADELVNQLGRAEAIQLLKSSLHKLQELMPLQPGYVGGNLLNLLRYLKADFTGLDCANLTLWQANFVGMNLHHVNFSGADVSKSVFTESLGVTVSVAFSPDGQLLVTAGVDGVIRLWRVADGTKLHVCRGHDNCVWSVRFSPDGRTLASGGSDRTIKLWDVETGECLRTLTGHTSWIWSVRFSPDGQTLASGSSDRTIKLWRLETGQCQQTFRDHQDGVFSIAFSPDSRLLTSASEDQTIKIWSLKDGTCLHTLTDHQGIVYTVNFNHEGTQIATGSDDKTIKIWDVQSGTCLHTLHGHTSNVLTLTFGPEDVYLVSSGRDGTIKLWNLETYDCIRTLRGHTARVFSVALSPDGRRFASGSDDKTVRLWNAESGVCLRVFQGYSDGVRSLRFSPDGRTLVSGGEDKTVHLWDVATQQSIQEFHGHRSWLWAVRFTPDGQMVVSGSDDRTIKLWDVATGDCRQTFVGNQPIFTVAVHPDGQIFASGDADPLLRIWDFQSPHPIQAFSGHTNRIWSTVFSPDGTYLVSGSHDRTLKVWDWQMGICQHTLTGHTGLITSVGVSPDSQRIISSSDDQTIRLWNAQTGALIMILEGHSSMVLKAAFSIDGQWMISGSDDTTVRVWDAQTGACLRILREHQAGVYAIALHPNGHLMATGSQDGWIKLWEMQTWTCIGTLRSQRPYEGMMITETRGLTKAETETLKALGANEVRGLR